MRLDETGAARTLWAILRHAASEREGIASIRGGADLVVASPGETSLLLARFACEDPADDLDGAYAPPDAGTSPPADDAGATLEPSGNGIRIGLGRSRLTLRRTGDPVEVEWLWPAQPPVLEAVVSRDALLDALPSGEGRLTYSGADKQLVLQAGRHERRLTIKNRPRRRNDLGTAAAFDQLKQLAEAAGPELTVGLADLRPLTIESGGVRGVLVRGAAMRWAGAEAPARPPRPAADVKAQAAAREAAERERAERERARAEAQRAKQAEQASRALLRAAAQIEAAAKTGELDDAALVRRIGAAARSVRQLAEQLAPGGNRAIRARCGRPIGVGRCDGADRWRRCSAWPCETVRCGGWSWHSPRSTAPNGRSGCHCWCMRTAMAAPVAPR